ncbi:MAG: class I SAM-dependent methyltransferase [Dehalococcoidia bacterium]|nr:MAG: class I SAM-dependent methyltransferase [Dehalococcoidia bacterium]
MAGEAIRPTESQAAAAWAEMVDGDAEQVARVREPEPAGDFYGGIAPRFRPGARPSLELPFLLDIAQAEDTWLDIGAGGGRFALPLSEHVERVIAVEPSESMRRVLREAIRESGRTNVEVHDLTWPSPEWTYEVDVSFAAHSIYDIREIIPFLDAMERCSRRACLAILADQPRGAHLARLFEAVHGEPFSPLPGLREFIALLSARGRRFDVSTVAGEPSSVTSLDEAATLARRLLWLTPDSAKDRRSRALIEEWWSVPGGVLLPPARGFFGVVAWQPVR